MADNHEILSAISHLLTESFKNDDRLDNKNANDDFSIEQKIIDAFEKLSNTNMKLVDVNEKIIDVCLNNIKKENDNRNRVSNTVINDSLYNKKITETTRYNNNVARINGISNIKSEKSHANTFTGTVANVAKSAGRSIVGGIDTALSREVPFYNVMKDLAGLTASVTKLLLPKKQSKTSSLFNIEQDNKQSENNDTKDIKDNINIGLNYKPLSESKVMSRSIAGVAIKYLHKKLSGLRSGSGGGFFVLGDNSTSASSSGTGGVGELLQNLFFVRFIKSLMKIPKKLYTGLRRTFSAAKNIIMHPIRTVRAIYNTFRTIGLRAIRTLRRGASTIRSLPKKISNFGKAARGGGTGNGMIGTRALRGLRNLLTRRGGTRALQAGGKLLPAGGGTAIGFLSKAAPILAGVTNIATNFLDRKDVATALAKDANDITLVDKGISVVGQSFFGNVGDGSLEARLKNALKQGMAYGAVGTLGGPFGVAVGALVGATTGFIGGDTIAKYTVKAKDKLVKSVKSILNKSSVEKDIYSKNEKIINTTTETLRKFNKDVIGDTGQFSQMWNNFWGKGNRQFTPQGSKIKPNTKFDGSNSDVLQANKRLNERLIAEGKLDTTKISDYINLSKVSSDNLLHLNPDLLSALLRTAEKYYEKTGKKLLVNEAARTLAQQQALYQGGYKAAKPGKSLHEKGLAVDISRTNNDFNTFLEIAHEQGLYQGATARGVSGELHHFELTPEKHNAAVKLANAEIENNKLLASQQRAEPNLVAEGKTIADTDKEIKEKKKLAEKEYNADIQMVASATSEQVEKEVKKQQKEQQININKQNSRIHFYVSDNILETIFGVGGALA